MEMILKSKPANGLGFGFVDFSFRVSVFGLGFREWDIGKP